MDYLPSKQRTGCVDVPMTLIAFDGGSANPLPGAAEYSMQAPGYNVRVPVPPNAAVPPAIFTPTVSAVTVLVLQMIRYLRLKALLPRVNVVPRLCELPDKDGIEQSANVGLALATCACTAKGERRTAAKMRAKILRIVISVLGYFPQNNILSG